MDFEHVEIFGIGDHENYMEGLLLGEVHPQLDGTSIRRQFTNKGTLLYLGLVPFRSSPQEVAPERVDFGH